MLCSLCLKHKKKYIQMPCNHHICYACFPQCRSSQNVVRYQCETCLSNHQIDLNEDLSKDHNPADQSLDATSKKSYCSSVPANQSIFCWTCQEAITLNQYIKGRHHQHSVMTYEQAIPSIKDFMLEQMQKTLTIKEYLQESRYNMQENRLKINFQMLVSKVNDFFQRQIQIVQRKRQNFLQQVKGHYNKSCQQVHRNITIITPILDQIQQLESIIESFLSDKCPITQINPISQIVVALDSYTRKLREKKFMVPQVPYFVEKMSVRDCLDVACSLFLCGNSKESLGQQMVSRSRNYDCQSRMFSPEIPSNKQAQYQPASIMQRKNDPTTPMNRKVKLVQKVKGKMKYTSSMCLTTFA